MMMIASWQQAWYAGSETWCAAGGSHLVLSTYTQNTEFISLADWLFGLSRARCYISYHPLTSHPVTCKVINNLISPSDVTSQEFSPLTLPDLMVSTLFWDPQAGRQSLTSFWFNNFLLQTSFTFIPSALCWLPLGDHKLEFSPSQRLHSQWQWLCFFG